MKVCSVSGCAQAGVRTGLCIAHYTRQRRHGSPDGGGVGRGHVRQWLVDHVLHDGDACLTWPFARYASGYGMVRHEGRARLASRAMCILAHGDPPSPDCQAAHSCGNGHQGCVNPRHLRWRTPRENNADKRLHGTQQRGAQVKGAKLNEDSVRRIRADLARGKPQRAIAASFGVSQRTVSQIERRICWGWVC